ncbi:MAG: MFS transporter [Chloroflexi bacterium]|jgi:MFS transporter, DHA3 family, macrolide efflux protein|nr:MFS transporter [Chloroflexota bacterium]
MENNTVESNSQQPPNWKTPFFAIWTGQAFSLLGSQIVQFAIIWYLTEKTGSATVLATTTLIALLPGVFLSPFIGPLVDRWNRRRIMILADSFIALATLVLAALFALGLVDLWHIYAVLFIRSIGENFHRPSMTASTSLMVPKEHLTRIQGVNQTLNGGLNIIAAPLGALLMTLIPMSGIVAIDVITALIAVVPLFFIVIPQPEKNPAESGSTTFWQDLRAGFKYVITWPGLLSILIMASMINFFLSPTTSLLPLLVKDHFNGGALQLGWINSLFGVGVIVGGLLLGVWGGFKRRIVTAILGIIGIGLGTSIMGMLPGSAFNLALGAFAFTGMMIPIANGSIGGILQAAVDPKMQGRVFSLTGSVATAMMPIGLAFAGPLSDAFGIQVWFILGGALTVLMGLIGFAIPAVMKIEDRSES